MMKIYKTIWIALTVLLIAAGITSCNKEKEYNKIDDLFQPHFITVQVVDTNNIALVWYEVANAASYTIEFHLDNYYRSLFATYTVHSTVFYLPDMPYATQFYIRIRCNSADGTHSNWAYTNALTLTRPNYAHILQLVVSKDIADTAVTIRWTLDANNPADSISLVPVVTTFNSIGRYLTSDEKTKGSALVDGLVKGALYKVNIYDTGKPRKYDKPYNEVTFRTTGGVPDTIYIGKDDDLSAILKANDADVTITDGDVYILPAGSFYKLTPYSLTKGFKLLGSSGTRPSIELATAWNPAEGSMISTFAFENIDFYQIVASQYFFNGSNSFTIDKVSFYNCTFKTFQRGFWRHQGANKLKHIKSITLENVTMDQCGASNSYGTFAINSNTADNIEKLIITNCTFMRQIGGMKNLFDYSSSAYPIDLEFHHVTLYSYCLSNKLINMPSAYGSTLVIDGLLLASNSGTIYTIPAGITTSFTNNYGTTDYLPGLSLMNGTALGVSAANLFTDAANGDLTIKDPNSPVVTNRVGDTRWLP